MGKSRKMAVFLLCFSHPSHTILMPLHTQGPLWVYNDCAKFYENRMDSFWEFSLKGREKKNDCISSRKIFPTPKNICGYVLRKNNIRQKNENFEYSPSAEKCEKGTLLDFVAFILLENIKKIEGRTTPGDIKKFRKKSKPKRGGESLIVPKNGKGDHFALQ